MPIGPVRTGEVVTLHLQAQQLPEVTFGSASERQAQGAVLQGRSCTASAASSGYEEGARRIRPGRSLKASNPLNGDTLADGEVPLPDPKRTFPTRRPMSASWPQG